MTTKRPKIDEGGRTALWYAACDGDFKKLKKELDAGADPNIGDFERLTPLYVAAVYGHAEAVNLLMEHDADPNLVDANGTAPLQMAAYEGHVSVVEALLQHAADPDHKNKWGVSPRAMAATKGNPEIMKLFSAVKRRRGKASAPGRPAPTPHEADGTKDETHYSSIHERLWNELVPPSGQAKTVQGEIIRIVGKLAREAFTNGNVNWDGSCTLMWRFVARTLDDDTFTKAERAQIKEWVRTIIADRREPNLDRETSPYNLVTEKAVAWVVAHPKPIRHKPDPRIKR